MHNYFCCYATLSAQVSSTEMSRYRPPRELTDGRSQSGTAVGGYQALRTGSTDELNLM